MDEANINTMTWLISVKEGTRHVTSCRTTRYQYRMEHGVGIPYPVGIVRALPGEAQPTICLRFWPSD